MWSVFRDFVKAPVFPDDEEKTRRARALNALHLNMGSAILVLGTLGVFFFFAEKIVTSAILVAGILVTIIGMALSRCGFVSAGGIFQLVFLWGLTVLMTTLSGGMRSLDIIFFISGTVIAGIVLGGRGALYYAGLSLLTGVVIIMVGNAGIVFPQVFTFPPVSAWIVLFINLIFTVVPLQVTLQSLADSAVRARASELRYRLIASVMSDYAFSIRYGSNGEITDQWMSGAFEAITGYTPEEYFAKGGWLSILHPDDRERDVHDMAKLHANQKVVTEIRIIRKDGETRWARSYAHPQWDEDNNRLAGIYGAVQDITDRKATEAELQQREAILKVVADAANTFLKISEWGTGAWQVEVDNLVERLGKTIHASHAYIFENHQQEDGLVRMSMRHEWTAPGFTSDLDNPKYQNMTVDEVDMENWNNDILHGVPYIGDAIHAHPHDMAALGAQGIHALLDVPITIDGQWWGTIGFDDMASPRNWSTAEVGALVVAANMLGAAIKRVQMDSILQNELRQRKSLIEELETKNVESETLRESTAIVASTLEISEIVQRVLEQLKRVVQYDAASVWLYRAEKAILMGSHNLPSDVNPAGEYVKSADAPDHMFWRNEEEASSYILLEDVGERYPIFRAPPLDYIRGWLGVSLRAHGKLIGYIALDSRQPGKFTEHDAELAVSLAEQVSIALENARLFSDLQSELEERRKLIEELERRNAESETLRESAAIVAATLERAETLSLILEQIARVVPYKSASVQLIHENMLEIVNSKGLDFNAQDLVTRFPINENEPAYPVIQGLLPYILYDDVQVTVPSFNEIPHDDIRAWMAIPLKVKGKVLGIIALDGERAGQFLKRDAELAVTYANQVAIALENSRLFSELQSELSQRQKLIQELESKNAELERFTYTVSHDLRSPLVTIRGFLGYLEKDASEGNMESFRKDLQRISNATIRMDTLLKEVLELSRIGRLINKPQDVPFADLVKDALEIVHGRLEQRGITLQTHPNLPTVHVDKPRLIEVLQNLLDNAAKYMGDQKEPVIEVGMDGYDEMNNPIFFVRDNGMGIAPEYHERIFGLFDKLDATSEGTGIGLALVKRIIEFHGGRVWVRGDAGQGATFNFVLPQPVQKN